MPPPDLDDDEDGPPPGPPPLSLPTGGPMPGMPKGAIPKIGGKSGGPPPDMPMAGAPKGAPPPGAKAGFIPPGMGDAPPLSYRKLFVWSLIVVGGVGGAFALATALETARKLLMQYNAKMLGTVISALKGGPTLTGSLTNDALIFAGLGIFIIALQFVSQYANVWVDTEMVRRLQQRLHDKLLALGPDYHDKRDLGRTSMVVMQFAAGAQPALRQFISFPFVDGLSVVAALYLLFEQLNTLASVPISVDLILAAVLLILPLAGWWLAGRVGRASAANIRARQVLNTEFINSATAPTEVRVLGAAAQRSRAFAARLDDAARTQRRANSALQVARQFQEAVPALLQTGFVIYAVFVVLATGSAEVGAIVTILLLVPQVVGPIQEVISYLTGLTANWPLIAEVGELLDAKPLETTVGKPFPVAAEPAVHFETVTFAYAPGLPPVVDHLDYVFRPGITTAIVGRSGTGKSSILALIAGLRRPGSGAVTIGGIPVQDIDPATLRASVVTISQFPLFITDTVRANFQLGKDGASDAEIEDAARRTGLWPVLERNDPHRPLDAPMGPTGQGLSGGERRLFAVTRALLRSPRILLMDEPTTGIDAIGVDLLERCLREACAGMTVIMVEHHLEFIERMADEVCCLEAGRFTAAGPPAELAEGDTIFARLLRVRRGLASTDTLDIATVPLPRLAGGAQS
jgi:ATP-binding cassette subfamily C protein